LYRFVPLGYKPRLHKMRSSRPPCFHCPRPMRTSSSRLEFLRRHGLPGARWGGGAETAPWQREGGPARGGAWRLGLQACARVVLIGLGQSSHGGRDARIFEAKVCLVCIALYRFYAFVPIWTSRHFFFPSKMRSSNLPCFCCYRLMRWFGAFGRVVRQQRVAGVSDGWRPKAWFFWFAA
jgi:hypothetical protein